MKQLQSIKAKLNGAKLWNEIPGRMRDISKKVFKRKLISVLFEILKDIGAGNMGF